MRKMMMMTRKSQWQDVLLSPKLVWRKRQSELLTPRPGFDKLSCPPLLNPATQVHCFSGPLVHCKVCRHPFSSWFKYSRLTDKKHRSSSLLEIVASLPYLPAMWNQPWLENRRSSAEWKVGSHPLNMSPLCRKMPLTRVLNTTSPSLENIRAPYTAALRAPEYQYGTRALAHIGSQGFTSVSMIWQWWQWSGKPWQTVHEHWCTVTFEKYGQFENFNMAPVVH